MKNIKTAIIFITLLIIFVLCWSIFTWSTRLNKVKINIDIIPTYAKIHINGGHYSSGESLYLKPGSYEYIIEGTGFATKTGKHTVKKSDSITLLQIMLKPVNEDAYKWIYDNQNLVLEFEKRAGEDSIKQGQDFISKNPIATVLPYISPLYTIGYKLDDKDETQMTIIITVNSIEQYRQSAIDEITNLGYNPSEFTYEFIDQENPFKL